jgi:hypothetical protein
MLGNNRSNNKLIKDAELDLGGCRTVVTPVREHSRSRTEAKEEWVCCSLLLLLLPHRSRSATVMTKM